MKNVIALNWTFMELEPSIVFFTLKTLIKLIIFPLFS
jgi:hypothetical protein